MRIGEYKIKGGEGEYNSPGWSEEYEGGLMRKGRGGMIKRAQRMGRGRLEGTKEKEPGKVESEASYNNENELSWCATED